MPNIPFEQRLAALSPRLSPDDTAKLATMVVETDRAMARLREAKLDFADEPAVVFKP